jgi:hypothetical protein
MRISLFVVTATTSEKQFPNVIEVCEVSTWVVGRHATSHGIIYHWVEWIDSPQEVANMRRPQIQDE